MEATIILKLPCKLTKQEMKENDIFNQIEKRVKVVLSPCKTNPNLITVGIHGIRDVEKINTVPTYVDAVCFIVSLMENNNITPDEVKWHDKVKNFKTLDDAISFMNAEMEAPNA